MKSFLQILALTLALLDGVTLQAARISSYTAGTPGLSDLFPTETADGTANQKVTLQQIQTVTATGASTAETLQSIFAQRRTIDQFDSTASPDGGTDYTAYFLAAATALGTNGGVLEVNRAGTYIIDSLALTNVVIVCQSTNVILKHRMSPAPTGPMFTFYGGGIIGGTLDGNKQATYAANSAVHANAILVKIPAGITPQRAEFHGVTFQNQIYSSIFVEASPELTRIVGNIFTNGWEYADEIDGANNPDARNSHYLNFNSQGSLVSPSLAVVDNYFGTKTAPASTMHFPVGIVVAGPDANSGPTVDIRGNKFENIPGVNLYQHVRGGDVVGNYFTNSTRYLIRANTAYDINIENNHGYGVRSDSTEMILVDATEHGGGAIGHTVKVINNDLTGSDNVANIGVRVIHGGSDVVIALNTITNVAKGIWINGGGSDTGRYKILNNTVYSTATPTDSTGAIHLENSDADFFAAGNVIKTESTHALYTLGLLTDARVFIADDNFFWTPSANVGVVAGGLEHLRFAGIFYDEGGTAVSSIASTAVITNLVFGKVEIISGTLSANWANITTVSGTIPPLPGAPTINSPDGTLYQRTDGTVPLYVRKSGAWEAVSTESHTHDWTGLTGIPAGFADGVDDTGSSGIDVQEVDGSPSINVTTLRFPNGSLTDNGAGVATVDLTGSGSSGYSTVQEQGSSLTARSTLNFLGGGVTAADNAGSTRTDVTVTRTGVRRRVWVDAGAMIPTDGALASSYSPGTTTDGFLADAIYFSDGASERCQWKMRFDNWTPGSVVVELAFTSSGTGQVSWTLEAGAIDNQEVMGNVLGAASVVHFASVSPAHELYRMAFSPYTIGSTPADNSLIYFRVTRVGTDGSDTNTSDAVLLGAWVEYTESATEQSSL